MTTFNLTYTQCKQIINNGYDLKEVLTELNEIPKWAHLNDIADIQRILQGGCSACAHISCFYADAKRIFLENTDSIEEVLTEIYDCELPTWDVQNDTFEQFISNMLQIAVEHICFNFDEVLNGVNWD